MDKKLGIFLYYIVLLAIFCTCTDPNILPPMPLRLLFLGAVMFPVFFYLKDLYPIIFILFYGVATSGVSYSYMPTTPIYYLGMTVLAVCIFASKNYKGIFPPLFLIVSLPDFVFVNFLTGGNNERIVFSLCLMLLMWPFLDSLSIKNRTLFSYAFIICSVVLSFQFLVVGTRYTDLYQDSGLERRGWTDPNYWGFVVAMGFVAAIIELYTRFKSLRRLERLFLYGCIVVTFIILVLNASRGSILGIALVVSVILLLSDIKSIYKILILGVGSLFIVFLFNNNYFALLEYRIYNDAGTGTGRTLIWKDSLNAFFDNGNIINYIFGNGNVKGLSLAYGYTRGTHNDFVAFLIEYGFVGLFLFLVLFLYPLKIVGLKNTVVLALTLFMLAACITLEPLSGGYFMFYAFWYYMVVIAKEENMKIQKV